MSHRPVLAGIPRATVLEHRWTERRSVRSLAICGFVRRLVSFRESHQ